MNARMQSVTSYAVSACGEVLVDCGKLAPATDLSGSLNVTLLDAEYLPFVDGLALDSATNVSQAFAFTASTDPGARPPSAARRSTWPGSLHPGLHLAASLDMPLCLSSRAGPCAEGGPPLAVLRAAAACLPVFRP